MNLLSNYHYLFTIPLFGAIVLFVIFYIWIAVDCYKGKATSGLICGRKGSIKDALILPLALFAFVFLAIVPIVIAAIQKLFKSQGK
jgi:hypothetical protein